MSLSSGETILSMKESSIEKLRDLAPEVKSFGLRNLYFYRKESSFIEDLLLKEGSFKNGVF